MKKLHQVKIVNQTPIHSATPSPTANHPIRSEMSERQPSPALAKGRASIKLLGPSATFTALTVAQISQWMKNAVTLDWDSVNANCPAWNARWNKTIER